MFVSDFFRTFGPKESNKPSMKKLILTSFVWVFSLLMAVAGPVSEQAAKQVAQEFIKRQMPALTRGEAFELTRAITGVADGDDAGIYVFNVQKGFVVMSADDKLPAVLAYGSGEAYDAQKAPEAMKALLEAYHYAATSTSKTRSDVPTHSDIAPLLKTQWDQLSPYNLLCPTDEKGNACPTGCAATAMAQVMYYHQWPASYDWDKMKTSYNSSDADESAQAVAKLMADVGTSINMQYARGGSSAYNCFPPEALRYIFGYQGAEYVERECYTAKQWDALIYNELSAKRPVIYSGQSQSSAQQEGHSFVLDGYQAKDGLGYYHVNWGWSGRSDDYFMLSVLNPANQYTGGNAGSSGYTFGQVAVVNVQKTETTNDNTCRLYVGSMSIKDDKGSYSRSTTSEDFPTLTLNFDIFNLSRDKQAKHYDMAIAIFKGNELVTALDEAHLKEILKDPIDFLSGYGLYSNVTFGKGLADGTYQIRILSREDGKSTWEWAMDAICRYIEVTISGTKMTTKSYGQYSEADVSSFKVNSVTVGDTREMGKALLITVNLTDQNKTGNSPIFLWGNASTSKGEDNFQLLTGGGTNLDPGETGVVVLDYTPQRNGDFKFKLSGTADNCDNPLYTFDVTIGATNVRAATTDGENEADVFNMQGIRMGKAVQLKSLPKGVYIINNKKIVNR